MHAVYILRSEKTERYYIGCTNNLSTRLRHHNAGYNKSTFKDKPWCLIAYREFNNQKDAYKFEKLIKSYKGGNAFKQIINGDVAEWSKAAPC